jgi:drug/metabolite transporter (DMT)-like permease
MTVDMAALARPTALPRRTVRAVAGGLAWAALAVCVFSGWFVVTRLGVLHQLRTWDVLALRFGGGALLMLPVLFKGSPRLPRRAWGEGLLFALFWGAPFVLLVALGLQLTSAALASSITPALMPIFSGLIGFLVWGEPPARSRLLGYVAIVGGLTALIAGDAPNHGAPSLGGVVALILAAGMWATYTLRFRRSGLTPLQAAALVSFWSAVFYLPLYLVLGLSRLGDAPPSALAFQVVYQGLMMSVVAIVAFNRAVASLGAGAAAAITALIPVIATAIAVPVLDERPSEIGAIAIGIIAIGVILAAQSAPPGKPI